MNRFGNDTRIDAKMGKIILESEATKESGNMWLKEILEEKEQPILKYNEIELLENKQKEFLEATLFNDFYTTACKEWELTDIIDDDKEIECSLCGQKDTKKKFYIKNKLNGTILNVGSTCINNFDDIRSIDGKTRSEIEKEWKDRKRDSFLNEKYPGIINKMDQWGRKIEELPTIIREDLEVKYFSISKQAKDLRDKFRKASKIDNTIADKINDLVIQGEEILNDINRDIDQKKTSEWFITKEIKEWYYKNNNDSTLESFLKEDGLIKWRSACRIYEPNFVEKIIEKLRKVFEKTDIKIKEFNSNRKTIIININDRNIYSSRINLECSYNRFMGEYGGTIFENEFDFQNEKQFVIENSNIVDDYSLNISVRNLKHLLSKYSLNIKNWDLEFNEITFAEYNTEKKNMYRIINLKKFINSFISLLYKNNLKEDEILKVKEYIKNNSSIMSEEEYKETLDRRERQEKAMQVNYNKFV